MGLVLQRHRRRRWKRGQQAVGELLPLLLFLSTGAPLTWPWLYILETPSAR